MELTDRHTAVMKISEMSVDQVQKVLIFMAGMEAGETVKSGDHKQAD